MPTRKVGFFDVERGFGFIGGDDGIRVFLHASTLPEGAVASKPRTRVEYGVADGRKSPQAPTMKILSPTCSVSVARGHEPQAMVPTVEDLIKLLDTLPTTLCNGKYPENSRATAKVLRAMVDDFDA